MNVRTILHDVRAMLSQARSPEIKISQKTPPESFLRRADPKKKNHKKKGENHIEAVLMALMHPYSKSVFIVNSFIPLPEGYLPCCSYTQHSCQICGFWHEMHIMVEKHKHIYLNIGNTLWPHNHSKYLVAEPMNLREQK